MDETGEIFGPMSGQYGASTTAEDPFIPYMPTMLNFQGLDPALVKQMIDQHSGIQSLKSQQALSHYDGSRQIMQKPETVPTTPLIASQPSRPATPIGPSPRAIRDVKLLDWEEWRDAYRHANGEANALRVMVNQQRQAGKPVYMSFVDKNGQVNRGAEVEIDTHDPSKFSVTYRGKDSHGQVRSITSGGVDFQSLHFGSSSTLWSAPPGWTPQPAPGVDATGHFAVSDVSYDVATRKTRT